MNKISLFLICLVIIAGFAIQCAVPTKETPTPGKKPFREVKLEIEQFFIANSGDSYYMPRSASKRSPRREDIQKLVSLLNNFGQYHNASNWNNFCIDNNYTPAQSAAFIEWLAEYDYEDVKFLYQLEQSNLSAWVYFPRLEDDPGVYLLSATGLFAGGPSLPTIEFDDIYAACYAFGIDTFKWWQTPEGNPSKLFQIAKS